MQSSCQIIRVVVHDASIRFHVEQKNTQVNSCLFYYTKVQFSTDLAVKLLAKSSIILPISVLPLILPIQLSLCLFVFVRQFSFSTDL